jgi:hypothetical protein
MAATINGKVFYTTNETKLPNSYPVTAPPYKYDANTETPALPRRYKGMLVPVHEYRLFSDQRDGRTFYHLLLSPAQYYRLLNVEQTLLDRFDVNKTARRAQHTVVDPKTLGLKTVHEDNAWYLFKYVKIESPDLLRDSSTHNLYLRCIYWENNDSFDKNGVSIVGIKMVDGDFSLGNQLDLSQLKPV